MEQIPPEIFTEVFRMAHEDGPVHEFYQTNQTPWSFSQVCQRWREITHTSPALWSRISMRLKAIEVVAPTLSSFKLLLLKVLARSKEHPLEIRLSTGDADRTNEVIAFAKTFMEILWPHRSRWLSFASDCRFEYRDDWTTFISNCPAEQGMPVLRKLVIPHLYDGEGHSTFMALFSRLPSLSLLCLGARLFPSYGLQGTSIDSIQWCNLHSLSLSFKVDTLPLVIPLLKHLHRVTILWLSCVFLDDQPPGQQEPHILPNVEALGLEHTLADWFFPQFMVPRLQALECKCFGAPHTLGPALAQSSASLRHLVLYQFHTTPDGTTELLRILEISPLELLSLDCVNEDVFLTVLTFLASSRKSTSRNDGSSGGPQMEFADGDRFPCPQLRHLYLSIDACRHHDTVSPPETYLDALTRFFDARVLPAPNSSSDPTTNPTMPNHMCVRLNTGLLLDFRSFPSGVAYVEHIREVTKSRNDLDVDVGYQQGPCPNPHRPVSSLYPDHEWRDFTPSTNPDCAIARLQDLEEERWSLH